MERGDSTEAGYQNLNRWEERGISSRDKWEHRIIHHFLEVGIPGSFPGIEQSLEDEAFFQSLYSSLPFQAYRLDESTTREAD